MITDQLDSSEYTLHLTFPQSPSPRHAARSTTLKQTASLFCSLIIFRHTHARTHASTFFSASTCSIVLAFFNFYYFFTHQASHCWVHMSVRVYVCVCVCFWLRQQRMWVFAQMHSQIIKRYIKSHWWQNLHFRYERVFLRLLFPPQLFLFSLSLSLVQTPCPSSVSYSWYPSSFISLSAFFLYILNLAYVHLSEWH